MTPELMPRVSMAPELMLRVKLTHLVMQNEVVPRWLKVHVCHGAGHVAWTSVSFSMDMCHGVWTCVFLCTDRCSLQANVCK
jgi:hypothetical protein